MNFSGKGFIGTAIFHVLLILLLIFWGFTTPLPLPAEKGILINFGDNNLGSGMQETRQSIPEPVSRPAQSEVEEKPVLTQQFEDAPAIKESPLKKKKEATPEPKKEPTPVVEKPKEPEREVNRRALYPTNRDNKPSDSDGVTGGSGNQGSETGSPDRSNYYSGLNKGEGGISFDLAGRSMQYMAEPRFTQQEEGVVVVEITVDKAGNVTNAIPGVKGSTTLNRFLLDEAKKAALSSKFDAKPDGPSVQKGTITYRFVLK